MTTKEKFVPFAKLSKKQQREIAQKKRGSWGLVQPVTKIKPSAKQYKRSKMKQDVRYYQGGSSSHILFYFVFLIQKPLKLYPTAHKHSAFCIA